MATALLIVDAKFDSEGDLRTTARYISQGCYNRPMVKRG
jgi:hypothetical protein